MLESWWDAHALEFLLTGGLVALCAVWALAESIAAAIKERKQKRKDGLL